MMKRKISQRIISLIAVMLIVTTLGYLLIFHLCKDNIIELQKDNLLSTVRVVSETMESYYEEKILSMDLFFKDKATSEDIQKYFEFGTDFSSGYLLNEDNEVEFYIGQDYITYLPDIIRTYNHTSQMSETLLEPPILTGDNSFTQFLVKGITDDENRIQYVVVAIDMEDVYQKIIQPIKVGENGYSMVKSYDGMIFMHKQKSQIGINSTEGRSEKYKEYNLDLTDLYRWFEVQQKNTEGCEIIKSYWWDDLDAKQVKKIVAFNQIQVGNKIWIVNGTLDYEEIEYPLVLANFASGFLAVFMAGILALLIYFVTNSENSKKAMEQEMNYLKELNEAFEELRKSEEMLRHADKVQTLGSMTGMISHEFNNFLTPIMLYGELMQADNSLGEENRKCLSEIVESAKKASELTKELARFGHRDNGMYHHVVLQIDSEINGSLRMIAKTIPKNIRLEKQIEEGEYYAKMPVGLISQAVMNICTNAIYAMREKGGVLTVLGEVTQDERYVLSIRDTGMGMPEWVVSQIFNPFYTTKESGQGTGLGLAVVKDLLHQIKGEIRVTSKENEGSCFYITLPLCQKEEKEEKKITHYHKKYQKVMILDDSISVAKALKASLSDQYELIQLYEHPTAALAELKKDIHAYQIVITSYGQEFMNGIEFSSIIRNLGFDGRIVMTYAYLDKDISWYLENQIINVALEKPVSREELVKVLDEEEQLL